MASPFLFRTSTRPDLSLCVRCAFRASNRPSKNIKRWLGTKYLAEVANAEKAWQAQAKEIKEGKQNSMLTKLEERGLVHTITGNRDEVDKLMTENRVGAYVGIDPTASSLHIGHMLPLMSLFWLYVHGYQTISLLGGATAKIGDPTDRLTTREKTKTAIRNQNMVKMHYQLKNLWLNVEAYGGKYGYKWEWAWKRVLVNNNAWMSTLPIMEVLQVLGPGMRIGSMLARDTVKNKMKNGDGMSFAEFSYPLLQAWDWWHMYQANGVQMQIGGSDQYGNITAGIDAIKYMSATHHDPVVRENVATRGTPFGFTVPLLTTSSGQKFGKSAGNAIWLDLEQTSSFELYKFFLATSDADVGRYLKLFTFMPIEQIDALVEEHMQEASQRKAQHTLAREFVELVHGEEEAQYAEAQHRLIYAKSTMSPEKYVAAQAALKRPSTTTDLAGSGSTTPEGVQLSNRPSPHLKLPRSAVEHSNIGRILVACNLADSSTEGHRLAERGGVHVGGLTGGPDKEMSTLDVSLTFTPVTAWKIEDTNKHLIDDSLLIFKRGKHNIRVIEVVSDNEYEELGLKYRGMKKRFSDEANKDPGPDIIRQKMSNRQIQEILNNETGMGNKQTREMLNSETNMHVQKKAAGKWNDIRPENRDGKSHKAKDDSGEWKHGDAPPQRKGGNFKLRASRTKSEPREPIL